MAADEHHASELALNAGVDMSMQSGLYAAHLPDLVASGEVPMIKANHLLVRNISVMGFWWGGYLAFAPSILDDSLSTLLDWYAAGELRPHVSHILAMEDLATGLQMLRNPPARNSAEAEPKRSARRYLRNALVISLTNPKVILFYGAFLPQFLDPSRELWLQFAVMALTFALVEGLVEYGLARLAQRIRPWLERSGQLFNRICGGLFATLGIALPLSR